MKLIKGDLYGGATAAIVALPLALAFGVSSGAGALAGLYGAVFSGFFAAVFGGTRTQVSGPTGPMTVVMALVITHFSPNLSAAFTVVILAGLMQIALGKIGVGRYIKLMPQPVISGFMSGIGIIIIILQVGPLIGVQTPDGPILAKLFSISSLLADINYQALGLGLFVLLVMYISPKKLNLICPPPLIAIMLGLLVTYFHLADLPVIGVIPTGFPEISVPVFSLEDIPYLIRYAFILSLLGSIDSLLTSLVADSITRTSHDSNKELIGQGIGNIGSGLFGGLPGAGATMRTLVNIKAGGETRFSGVFHSILLLIVVLGFSEFAQNIPLAVLAGILVKVGIDIIDWDYLKRIHSAPRAGVVIMLTTLVITVFVDLMTGVVIGFVMASVLFVSRMAEAQINSARLISGDDELFGATPEEQEILRSLGGRIVLFHVEGPLSFGSARDIAKLIQSDIKKDVLAVDMTGIPFIDSSASAILEEVVHRTKEAGEQVILFGAKPSVQDVMRKTGLLSRLGNEYLLPTRHEALLKAKEIIDKRS